MFIAANIVNSMGNVMHWTTTESIPGYASVEAIAQDLDPEEAVVVGEHQDLSVQDPSFLRVLFWAHPSSPRLLPIWQSLQKAPMGLRRWMAVRGSIVDKRALVALVDDTLQKVSDENIYLLNELTGNKHVPGKSLDDIFEKYVKGSDDYKRTLERELLDNTSTPIETILKIGPMSDERILHSLLKHPALEENLAMELANSKIIENRLKLAKNQNAPAKVIQKLTNDRSSRVREAAKKTAQGMG